MSSDAQPVAPVVRLTYTTEEVCQALRISRPTLWKLHVRGVLTPIPGIRRNLYSVKAVEAFVAQSTSKCA